MPLANFVDRAAEGLGRILSSKPVNQIRGIHKGPGFVRGKALSSELYGGMKSEVLTRGFGAQAALFGAVGGAAGFAAGDGDWGSAAKGASLGVLGAVGHRGFKVGRNSYRNGLLGPEVRNARQSARAAGRAARDRYYDLRGEGAARRLGYTPRAAGEL